LEQLTQRDLWPNQAYEGVREQFRREVIAAKRDRRISVGPFMSFVFENRLTVKFQVQEILRVEKIVRPEQVQEELDGFNTMLPGPGELSATLLIELQGPEAEVAETLRWLTGLGSTIRLFVGGRRVDGVMEGGRDDGSRVAAVQYVRFACGVEAAAMLEDPAVPVELEVAHPRYAHRASLSLESRRSLAGDLRSPERARGPAA
jgi:hypothetical protein